MRNKLKLISVKMFFTFLDFKFKFFLFIVLLFLIVFKNYYKLNEHNSEKCQLVTENKNFIKFFDNINFVRDLNKKFQKSNEELLRVFK